MNWEIQISGDERDLKELSKSLVDAELKLTERDGKFFLQSDRFETLPRYEKVRSLALEVLPILTGATRLTIGSRIPLEVAGISRIRDNGIRDVFIQRSDTLTATGELVQVQVNGGGSVAEVKRPANNVPAWVKLGLTDSNVSKALRLWAIEEHNWVGLYRIYEVIKDDVGGLDKIVNRGWATKASIECFRRTANSPAAVGDGARHGSQSTTPPPNPMDLGEANLLVETLLRNWLNCRMQPSPPSKTEKPG